MNHPPIRSVRNIQEAIVRLPCEEHEYPTEITTTIFDVHDYGRSVPRGLVVHEGEIWIVNRGRSGRWHLETKISEVLAHQHGGDFTKWRNYLRRIVRWPWEDEDTRELLEGKS